MCEVFVTRLVPETTASDVLRFVKPRINRNVKIEQLRTKYDEYSSFNLCVPKFLKNKLLDKIFWENDNIYVRELVTKSSIDTILRKLTTEYQLIFLKETWLYQDDF